MRSLRDIANPCQRAPEVSIVRTDTCSVFPPPGGPHHISAENSWRTAPLPVQQLLDSDGDCERSKHEITQTIMKEPHLVTAPPRPQAPLSAATPPPPLRNPPFRVHTPSAVIREFKASSAAPLSPNQASAFPLLQQFGGAVRGTKGAPNIPQGTLLPPIRVQTIRQDQFQPSELLLPSLTGSTQQ